MLEMRSFEIELVGITLHDKVEIGPSYSLDVLIQLGQSTNIVERLNCNLLDPFCRWLFCDLDKSVDVILFDELEMRRRPRKVPKSSQKFHGYNVAVEKNTQVS